MAEFLQGGYRRLPAATMGKLSYREPSLFRGYYRGVLASSAIPYRAARENGLEIVSRGLEFPYHSISGRPTGFSRVRLRHDGGGAKYLQPPDTGNHLYIPLNRGNAVKLAERGTRVVVVEGEKKAISVAEALIDGWAAVAIGGVNSIWIGQRKDRKYSRPLYTVFEMAGIPWLHERGVYVLFDSDKLTNMRVRMAEAQLLSALRERGCEVHSVDVPVAGDGRRQGADDWIASDGPAPLLEALFLSTPKIMPGVPRPIDFPERLDVSERPEPPKFYVYPSIQAGANLWFGLPETLKSLTRNQAILDLLSGKPALFGAKSPWENRWEGGGLILVVCSEEPRSEFTSGLWRCAEGNGMRPGEIRRLLSRVRFYSAPEYDLRLDRLVEAWDRAGRPKIVFADHLLGLIPRRNFAGKEVNAIADPQIITDTFLQVRMLFMQEKVAFVCVAHTSRANEGVFGSINWEASSDTITKFHRERGDDQNLVRVVLQPWKRRKSAKEPVFAIKATFMGSGNSPYKIWYDGEAEAPSGATFKGKAVVETDTPGKVVAVVQQSPGMTYEEMAEATGVKVRYLRQICQGAVLSGEMFKYSPNHQVSYWYHSKPPEGL